MTARAFSIFMKVILRPYFYHRFALAENKHGDSARAQALFEHTLTSYPTRVDVWGVYVDMLVKSDRVDLARQVSQWKILRTYTILK